MTILCDEEICELCDSSHEQPMISPFIPAAVRTIDDRKILSCGLTSYGYDVRLSDKVKIFTNMNAGVIDPKRLNTETLVDAKVYEDNDGTRDTPPSKYVLLPPNSYMLGVTMETFKMPRDVVAICMGKSTYARAAAIVNVTPIEPGFEGTVVIEISNSSSLPLKIYVEEGIAQFMFFRGNPCRISYADKGGKYQGQVGIQLPIV